MVEELLCGKGGWRGEGVKMPATREKNRGEAASKHLNPSDARIRIFPPKMLGSGFSLRMMDPDGSNGDAEAEPMCHNCVAAVIQVSKCGIIIQ